MPEALISDILSAGLTSTELDGLLGDLRRGWYAEVTVAAERQAKMGAWMRQHEEGSVDGLGVRVATVDPVIYFEMTRRYGLGCWADKSFRRDMLRDEPSLRTHRVRKTVVNGFDVRREDVRGETTQASAGAGTEGGIA